MVTSVVWLADAAARSQQFVTSSIIPAILQNKKIL